MARRCDEAKQGSGCLTQGEWYGGTHRSRLGRLPLKSHGVIHIRALTEEPFGRRVSWHAKSQWHNPFKCLPTGGDPKFWFLPSRHSHASSYLVVLRIWRSTRRSCPSRRSLQSSPCGWPLVCVTMGGERRRRGVGLSPWRTVASQSRRAQSQLASLPRDCSNSAATYVRQALTAPSCTSL